MKSAHQAIKELWTGLGLPERFLERLRLTGNTETAVQSSFRLGAAAQASIASSALGAAYFNELITGKTQTVSVDARHAVLECASERLYELDGKPPPPLWDALAGAYRTRDGWVRIHTNFPHHRDGILKILGCEASREEVSAALRSWSAVEFETVASQQGMCVAALRSFDEWDATPQARANEGLPPVEVVRIGDAPPRPRVSSSHAPFAGIRVLELTRVLAGPTCGRTLAGHGADVLWVTSPNLPDLPGLDVDTSRGKRTTQLDLTHEDDLDRLRTLASEADVFLQSYRADALADKGLSPTDLAALKPGIVYAHLNAYGWHGPWRTRRGFDSLVQTASGFNLAEAHAFASEDQSPDALEPRPLPFQALDHVAGYMLALGTSAALCRRITEGGSWEVRVSLAGVASWIRGLGRVSGEVMAVARPLPLPGSAEVEALLEPWRADGRVIRAIRHAARLSCSDSTTDVPRDEGSNIESRQLIAPLVLNRHRPVWR
ncbi:putative CoA-transferase family III, CaiB/BaiF family [Exidia glandulosa HHB12029]|uniref:Putative CoA-transferase family III, CaiB/BaiF family n=1 Tax=Exidia glandulosa HHB12029 TaxID=1314781 RepID=A0A165HX11_EXIGL|nr:putative CoA-transferase family III, CaiB/BaiF family [Exidia glandulosa HHB12029]